MNKKSKILVSAMLGLALFGATPLASAQNDPRDQIIQSLELQDAPIRDALRILFKNVGVSYTIASDVQGTVTASLKSVPFETALRNLLGQVDATYRVEASIFNIVRKETQTDVGGGNQLPNETLPTTDQKRFYRIKIQRADPQYVYMLLRGEMGFNSGPEISTLSGGGFGGQGGGGFGGGGFGGGGAPPPSRKTFDGEGRKRRGGGAAPKGNEEGGPPKRRGGGGRDRDFGRKDDDWFSGGDDDKD